MTSAGTNPVSAVMTRVVEHVSPTTSIRDAARTMERVDVGSLPVVQAGEIVGFVTDRDLVLRGIAREAQPRSTLIRDVMTPTVIAIPQDTNVGTAVKIMTRQRIRRVMVVDDKVRLVGILSVSDLVVRGLDEEALQALRAS